MAIRPAFGVVADPFVGDNDQTSTWTGGADPALSLTKTTGTGAPAGARIYGVEGLDVSQLGKLSFDSDGGPCTASGPSFVLFYDLNGDGTGDTSSRFNCSAGGAGTTKTFDPVALGVPGNAKVTALDVWYSGPAGTTAVIDNISVLGATITDTQVARTA
jgi:hypothetical protein